MGRLEVEVKVRVHGDPHDVGVKLRSIGFNKVAEEQQVDIYFSHPCYDLASRDEALRLRIVGGKAILCFKGPRLPGPLKSRKEIEVEVSNAEECLELLSSLGFKELAKVIKRRRIFERRGVKVCVDSVEGLGHFLEVEADNPEDVLEVLKVLGYDVSDVVRETYLEMILSSKKSSNS